MPIVTASSKVESGLSAVSNYIWKTERGWITDGNGQYSLYGIKPGNHVIKVDPITLPDGVSLKPTDNRHMADANSRLVDLRTGEFHRADFVASCPKEEAEYVFEQIQARNAGSNDWMLQHAEKYDPNKPHVNNDLNRKTGADGDLSNGRVGIGAENGRTKANHKAQVFKGIRSTSKSWLLINAGTLS